jgi:hypothetical protein
MADNQLNHDELLRLECLTRAINHASFITDVPDARDIVVNADKFEKFVKDGSN